jgi:hypothetical protein
MPSFLFATIDAERKVDVADACRRALAARASPPTPDYTIGASYADLKEREEGLGHFEKILMFQWFFRRRTRLSTGVNLIPD